MEKFPIKIVCIECKKPITGWVYWQDGNIFDSSGFVAFDSEYLCDKCHGRNAEFDSKIANEKMIESLKG